MKGIIAAVCTSLVTVGAQASVIIETVPIGNPGNVGELTEGGQGPQIVGGVNYSYSIGRYEITAGQYTEFLNAVAAWDTYGLYTDFMWTSNYGCKIQRFGSQGYYSYSVAPDWANRPVNVISWGDAARFANWMHNGQPIGSQGPFTTENGSYLLNGAIGSDLAQVERNPDATWVIPSEHEWYKAAYHKNDGATGNYFDYPTASDSWPRNDLLDPDPGNNATYLVDGLFTIDSPYYRTEVGAHENSASPYGTFDQGGNLMEWTEELVYYAGRGLRGGSFANEENILHAEQLLAHNPGTSNATVGFRLALVPEPTSLSLLLVPALIRRRRRG